LTITRDRQVSVVDVPGDVMFFKDRGRLLSEQFGVTLAAEHTCAAGDATNGP